MTTSATVPVTVTPEAATRIAELGFQTQVDRMIDYARENLPELTRIEVVLNERYDLGGEPGVAIEAYRRYAFDPPERIRWRIGDWLISEFPPEVLEHLMIDYLPEAPNAG
jgi:hypothetical protein